MKNSICIGLTALGLACTPVPELAAIVPIATDGGAADEAIPGRGGMHFPTGDMGAFDDMRRSRGDLEFSGDMGSPPPTAPCPTIAGPAVSFCYWPAGTGSASLATALALQGMNVNCALTRGQLAVNAATNTCSVAFTPAASGAWAFATDKPVHLTFSYSMKTSVDRAILTVEMPAGSMNQVLKVDGVYGSQNIANLYSPAGVMFAPGFSVALAGTAAKTTVSFDWISVWQ